MTTSQAALSLADDVAAPGADLPSYPAGTFENDTNPSAVEWTRGLTVARGVLATLPAGLALVLDAALTSTEKALAKRLEKLEGQSDGGLVLFDADAPLPRKALDAFLAGLDSMPSLVPGLEMKQRTHRHGRTTAVWMPGVGELQVAQLGTRTYASFGLFKTTVFLPSYEDGAPVYELPEQIWSGAICCGALCESNSGVASIRAVTHEGRMYAVTGGMFGRDISEGIAWLLVPRQAWVGPTGTYESIVAAFQDGSRQRGDDRGLVVSVRGQQYVLGSFARFVDNRAPEVRNAAVYGARPANQEEEGLEEEEFGAVHGLAQQRAREDVDQLALF